ncbi:MAG: NAD(P)H-dependent glycerol-3-phosphate dehydrogenase [Alphaproteobacteria bacterium]|nr:NAD(P)H-dependent glycerol-3-phosphate dehydrogenase [Alphaproteobacteria bacterium]
MATACYERIGILGAGAWGTALANVVGATGRTAVLAPRTPETAEALAAARTNAARLPGVALHENVVIVASYEALSEVDAIVYAAPTQVARGKFEALARTRSAAPVVIASKGIEIATGLTLPEVLAAVWPAATPAMLSGPTFAHDVAAGRPAAATLACAEANVGEALRGAFASSHFRLYPSSDVLGVALGGAAKNVLAIAAGVVIGAQLGESARAALLARGFAEIQRLGMAIGADAATLYGLSGLGDLILTATSPASRNMSLGIEIGSGGAPSAILASRSTVSEGALTAGAILERADACGVDMPICRSVADLIAGVLPLDEIVANLMTRPAPVEAG